MLVDILNQLVRHGREPEANYAAEKRQESHSDFTGKLLMALKKIERI